MLLPNSAGLTSSGGSAGDSRSEADSPPPASKYISPFGETDAQPVFADAKGRLRSATGKILEDRPTTGLCQLIDPYFSLPNTPDTENPLLRSSGLRPVDGRVIQLNTEIAGESYI